MRSRLEAFIAPNSGNGSTEKSVELEPDEKFHEKLQTFRKISEGTKQETEKQPKPKLSYSSLIGAELAQANQRTLQPPIDDEDENDDSVDKLLDDALEESYRSVLEESESRNSSLRSDNNDNVILKGDIFLPEPSGLKAPPSEKPPPPPPTTTTTPTTVNDLIWQQAKMPHLRMDDADIDKEEKEILASLENEEREHQKYMESVVAMRNSSPPEEKKVIPAKTAAIPAATDNIKKSAIPLNENEAPPVRKASAPIISSGSRQTGSTGFKSSSSLMTSSSNNKVLSSSSSQPNLPAPAKKKTSQEVDNQKPYNSQHWVIREAEQRRLAEIPKNQANVRSSSGISPASSSPATSTSVQSPSPVYENLNQQIKSNNVANYSSTPSFHGDWPSPGQARMPPASSAYPVQENLYANVGSMPAPPKPAYPSSSPDQFLRDPHGSQGRLPGPQVPPRTQADRQNGQNGSNKSGSSSGERMLSVSGKKKCSHCKEELGRGAAMIIGSLRLFYHLRCFQCCVCHVQLGNGTAGTDVRVRNNKLHCQNCYSNDEGLKFSKV